MKLHSFDGGYDFNSRRKNESNSFVTASMLLNEHTDKDFVYKPASVNDDVKKGIDIYWGPLNNAVKYHISVRERIYAPKEMEMYKNMITIRANDEMKKIIHNVDAMVYIRRSINKHLLGYSIISVAAMTQEILKYDCCDFENDYYWYKKLPWLTKISYSRVHNDFYSIDLNKLPDNIKLAHINF